MKTPVLLVLLLSVGLAIHGCGNTAPTASTESEQSLGKAAERSVTTASREPSKPLGVADRLNMPPRQRAALEKIQKKYRELSNKVTAEGKTLRLSKEEMTKRALRMRNAYDKEVMAILTPEQKRLYQTMKAGR